MKHCCDQMSFFLQEKKVQISYVPRFREYGIFTVSGGMQLMNYCPWCGVKFPDTKRDEWFDELEKIGIEADLFPKQGDVPDKFLTDEWWNITPARFPDQHQKLIHGKGGAYEKLLKSIGN